MSHLGRYREVLKGSVAVAALPQTGKQLLEKWFSSRDPDVIWIMKENLRKKRLTRIDAAWVEKWQALLGG